MSKSPEENQSLVESNHSPFPENWAFRIFSFNESIPGQEKSPTWDHEDKVKRPNPAKTEQSLEPTHCRHCLQNSSVLGSRWLSYAKILLKYKMCSFMEAPVTWFSHLSSRIRLLRQPSANMLFVLRKTLTDWRGKADIIPDGSRITHGLAALAY